MCEHDEPAIELAPKGIIVAYLEESFSMGDACDWADEVIGDLYTQSNGRVLAFRGDGVLEWATQEKT